MASGTAMMTAVLRLFLRLRFAHGEPTSCSTREGIPSRLGLLAPQSLVSPLKVTSNIQMESTSHLNTEGMSG